MATEVTDPALLEQLERGDAPAEVSDPAVVGALEGGAPAAAPAKPLGVMDSLVAGAKGYGKSAFGGAEALGSLASQAVSYLPSRMAAGAQWVRTRYAPWDDSRKKLEMMIPPVGHPASRYKTEEERTAAIDEMLKQQANEDAGNTRRLVENLLPNQPQTEEGQQALRGIAESAPMRGLKWVGDRSGDAGAWINDQLGGSPADQETVRSVYSEAAPALLTTGLGRLGSAAKNKLAPKLRERAAAVSDAKVAQIADNPTVSGLESITKGDAIFREAFEKWKAANPDKANAILNPPTAAPTTSPRGLMGALLREPKPTPLAQYLLDRGVRLTKGQLDPTSPYGQVELASTSKGGVGPLIRKQRQIALEQAMDLGFTEAAPPGVNLTAKLKAAGNDINAKYEILKGAWDDAYSAVRGKGEQIYPALHDGKGGVPLASTANKPGLFAQIVDDAGTIWDDANRTTARRFLENQITRLPESKGALGKVDLGDMMKVSSEIKKARSAALKKQNYDLAEIFDRAGDAVDDAIASQAAPETQAALQALRGKYRDFKVMEDAVIRTGDSPGGISPARLSSSVRAADSLRSDYAAGGGGPLRELSRAIAKVFDESASPNTGARILTTTPGLGTATGSVLYMRNPGASAPVTPLKAPPSARMSDALSRLPSGSASLSQNLAGLAAYLSALRERAAAQGGAIQWPLGLAPAGAQEEKKKR